MKMTKMFGVTLRDIPSGTEAISHQLLLRAGYIHQLGQGIFSYLPLAKRSLSKIENIMRDEINAIGGQEITMPVVNPAEVWKATGRWYSIGPEMARFKDRRERDMVLAMTHEEVVADLCKSEIQSYRQLPQLIYHIQTKFRDDPRPRAGLIRVREFTMKDSYSLDIDEKGLDIQYRAHYQAYFNIFNKCGVPVIAVGSDVGMMGGNLAHEYMYLTPVGEDTLVLCSNCGYAANQQIAEFQKKLNPPEELANLSLVETPNVKTIEDLAAFLRVPKNKIAKSVLMIAGFEDSNCTHEEFVFAIVRGDMEVNETKLSNAIKANWLRPATEEEIFDIGSVPGYASPIEISNVTVVVDEIIPKSANLISGANRDGFHLLNVNVPRDFSPSVIADIAAACDGDTCIRCGNPLYTARGVEVGNIFKLGTRYSEAVNTKYLAADGTLKPIVMGSYGIGSGRLLACAAEENHDEHGLCLPITIAPYQVHLVSLFGKNPEIEKISNELYELLTSEGIEVLFDDRDESPGVKFADADLIGLPIRITVSKRSLINGGVEMKIRALGTSELVSKANVIDRTKKEISHLYANIMSKVLTVPFK